MLVFLSVWLGPFTLISPSIKTWLLFAKYY
jgi:hypothetical protein